MIKWWSVARAIFQKIHPVSDLLSKKQRASRVQFFSPPKKNTRRPPGCPCCPEGLLWEEKKKKMSLCPDSGYFPLAWCRTFCMLSASMQIPPGHSCKKMQTTLSLTLSPPPHAFSPPSPRWLYGCSLFDVFPSLNAPPRRCLLLSPVLLFLLPSFLSPFLPSLPLRRLLSGVSSRLTSLAVTLDFKELLHSSVTHQREGAIQRHAKREGGDEEWVYKKNRGGTSVWKEGTREKEDPLLTAGNLWESQQQNKKKKKKEHTPTQLHTHTKSHSTVPHTLFLCVCCFCPVGCVPMPHTWSLPLFFFSLSPLSICLLSISFIPFTWAGSTKGGCWGLFLPVIPRCTCACVCVCVSFFFPKSFLHSPVFLKSRLLYFHRLRAHWHSPSFLFFFFLSPFLCILRWLAS